MVCIILLKKIVFYLCITSSDNVTNAAQCWNDDLIFVVAQ